MKYTVVIGAVNIDVGGASEKKLIFGDSNPGRIGSSLGGVGRNIAHNMALLGLNVSLITALGADSGAQRVLESCADIGIDASASLTVSAASTSTYLFINDAGGDMALALSDMTIYNNLLPEFLETRCDIINGAEIVLVDTNIPEASIIWLAENCTAPLFCDPVSVTKAEKLRMVLGKFHTIKPNRIEAELLSGVKIRDEISLKTAADALLSTGLKRVFISLGSDGVYAAEKSIHARLSCPPTALINATGGGDASCAALAYAYTEGMDLVDSAAFALAAGSIAVEHKETINPNLCLESIMQRLERNEKL